MLFGAARGARRRWQSRFLHILFRSLNSPRCSQSKTFSWNIISRICHHIQAMTSSYRNVLFATLHATYSINLFFLETHAQSSFTRWGSVTLHPSPQPRKKRLLALSSLATEPQMLLRLS